MVRENRTIGGGKLWVQFKWRVQEVLCGKVTSEQRLECDKN